MPNKQKLDLSLSLLDTCDLADAVRGDISRLEGRLKPGVTDPNVDMAVVREKLENRQALLAKLGVHIKQTLGDMVKIPVRGGCINLGPDYISIHDSQDKEVVYWDSAEWAEDPETAQAILRAMTTAVDTGVGAVAERIPPYPDEA